MSKKGGSATSVGRARLPLKWHGGKFYLASKIVALMPGHTHYVEPYFGGGAVMLTKNPEGISEVANDIDGRLMNFWRVLQVDYLFNEFARLAEATPFSEVEWDEAFHWNEVMVGRERDMVFDALQFFILCRQSMAGRLDSFAPLSKTRTRRGMNEQASAWLNAVDGLRDVHARLRRVVILNRKAVDVIRTQDGEETLFYLDPTYLQETRASKDVYEFEMTYEDHVELLGVIKGAKGKVMISGYRSQLYDGELSDWTRHEFDLPNNAASGGSKKRMTECLWCNF